MNPPLVRVAMPVGLLHADPQRALFKGKQLQFIEQRMALGLRRAGALPVPMLDLGDPHSIEHALDHVDGLLLQGGADVAPHHYGLENPDPRWPGDPVLDAFELAVIAQAHERGMPILGVCRGAQVLNVARGGSLLQDIGTHNPTAITHRDWHNYDETGHDVELDGSSWLAQIYETTALHVNSVHHQAIDRPGERLRVTARGPDGVVEAVEAIDDEHFAVGIQWHPEWLDEHDPVPGRIKGDPVFEAFVREILKRKP